jgi:hypothetical protein
MFFHSYLGDGLHYGAKEDIAIHEGASHGLWYTMPWLLWCARLEGWKYKEGNSCLRRRRSLVVNKRVCCHFYGWFNNLFLLNIKIRNAASTFCNSIASSWSCDVFNFEIKVQGQYFYESWNTSGRYIISIARFF